MRFNTFKWLHSCVGLACCLGVEDRPRFNWTNTRPAGRQAITADLEILIAVKEVGKARTAPQRLQPCHDRPLLIDVLHAIGEKCKEASC